MQREKTEPEFGKSLLAYMQNTCSPEEREEVEKWLLKKENADFFERIKKKKLTELYKNFEVDEIKNKKIFGNRIEHLSKLKKRRKTIFTISKYAASITILAGISYILIFNGILNFKQTEEVKIVKQLTQKTVILHLASGKKIALSANISADSVQNNSISQINNNYIKYKAVNKSKKIAYNTIEVPCNNEFYLELSDGTKIWLNSDSKLKYPECFTNKERVIWLEGEAYMEVKHDETRDFIVNMKNSKIKVLGTKFNARNYADECPVATLVEGKVAFSDISDNKVVLKPGQQAKLINEKIITQEVEVFNYIAWKDGYFVFTEISLDRVLMKLSRYYGFEYSYENKKLGESVFSAKIKKYKDVNKLLKIIETAQNVKIEIINNKLIIRSK